jgi:hypothetical protein
MFNTDVIFFLNIFNPWLVDSMDVEPWIQRADCIIF